MNEFVQNHALVVFSGGVSIVVGLLIVLSHNIWVAEWPVLITLVGWLMLLQGVMRVFFPDSFAKCMKDLMHKTGYLLMSWIGLIVGIYLVWIGFKG